MRVFRKYKMMERLTKEGLLSFVGPTEEKIMDDLDGKEVHLNQWQAQVHGVESYYATTDEGHQYPVHPDDVEEVRA